MNNKGTGGPPVGIVLSRAVELTEDGGWHNYADLMRELAKLVQPGKAIRKAEKNRLGDGGPAVRTKNAETERVIQTGKNAVVREFLTKPWFEVKPTGRITDGTVRQIRLTKIPTRLLRDRERAEEGRLMQPEVIIPELLVGIDAKKRLGNMDSVQLIRLIQEMVQQIQDGDLGPVSRLPVAQLLDYPEVPENCAQQLRAKHVRKDVRDRARKILADREWHDFDATVREVGQVVDPEVAVWRAEVNRVKGGPVPEQRSEIRDTEELVQIGRRAVVREALRDMKGPKMFEIYPPGLPGRRKQPVQRYIRYVG